MTLNLSAGFRAPCVQGTVTTSILQKSTEKNCGICRSALEIGSNYKGHGVIGNDRMHIFHTFCLDAWINTSTLAGKKICPLCTCDLVISQEHLNYLKAKEQERPHLIQPLRHLDILTPHRPRLRRFLDCALLVFVYAMTCIALVKYNKPSQAT